MKFELPSSDTVQSSRNKGRWSIHRRIAAVLLVLLLWILVYQTYSTDSHTEDGPFSCRRHESDHWIRHQEDVSYRKILGNIGARAGAKDGLVVASQSRGGVDEPDYFYTWTRDSALTIKTLLPRFLPPRYLSPWSYQPNDTSRLEGEIMGDPLLENLIRSYITSQNELQRLDTLSGNLWTGGLNEPKYTAQGEPFNGDWGRPQTDGPPLRALALIPYAHYILDRNHLLDVQYVEESLYDPTSLRSPGSVIKNDLEEIAHGWQKEGFDLWEEVNGHHLWTRMVALRALQAGAIFAARMEDPLAAEFYGKTAREIIASLSDFWVQDEGHHGYWASSISYKTKLRVHSATRSIKASSDLNVPEEVYKEPIANRHEETPIQDPPTILKGLDCGFLLSVIHTTSLHHSEQLSDVEPLEPSHSSVLATLRLCLKSFDEEYPLNNGTWLEGRLVGRYKGDKYDGVGMSRANPWFICSYSVAHVAFLAHESISRAGVIHLDPLNRPFWSELLDQEVPDHEEDWVRGSRRFHLALEALWQLGERYFSLTSGYIRDGSMSEQINRVNGTQTGARDLTWSHAAFLEAAAARRRASRERRQESDELGMGGTIAPYWQRIWIEMRTIM